MECGCPNGGGIKNGRIRYPSYGGMQGEKRVDIGTTPKLCPFAVFRAQVRWSPSTSVLRAPWGTGGWASETRSWWSETSGGKRLRLMQRWEKFAGRKLFLMSCFGVLGFGERETETETERESYWLCFGEWILERERENCFRWLGERILEGESFFSCFGDAESWFGCLGKRI